MTKDTDEHPDRGAVQGEGRGGGAELPRSPRVRRSSSAPPSSPAQISEPRNLRIFMEASSLRYDRSLTPFAAPLPSLGNPKLLIMALCTVQKPAKSCLVRTTKRHSYHPGNPKGFRSAVSGTRGRDHYIFFCHFTQINLVKHLIGGMVICLVKYASWAYH